MNRSWQLCFFLDLGVTHFFFYLLRLQARLVIILSYIVVLPAEYIFRLVSIHYALQGTHRSLKLRFNVFVDLPHGLLKLRFNVFVDLPHWLVLVCNVLPMTVLVF